MVTFAGTFSGEISEVTVSEDEDTFYLSNLDPTTLMVSPVDIDRV